MTEAVRAEQLTQTAETYAASTRNWMEMGRIGVSQQVTLETTAAYEQGYDDFASSFREMLRTDGETRQHLDIDDKREHQVVNGQAVDKDGRSILDIVKEGQRISEAMAEVDPIFEIQAMRDKGDTITAKTANQLKTGESWVAVSMDPKDGLEKHPEIYHDQFGYRDGLLYIQWYHRADQDTLVAGSFSVDRSDESIWRDILAEEGVIVPEDVSPNSFILYGIKKHATTAQETEAYVCDLRSRYYARIGASGERHSVSQFMQDNEAEIRGVYSQYYPALTEAAYTGKNNKTLQKLAQTMLRTDVTDMKAEVRTQLMQVANSDKFSVDLAKKMDIIIRYATVEALRPELVGRVEGKSLPLLKRSRILVDGQYVFVRRLTDELLAGGMEAGIRAGRSYGGCPGEADLSENYARNAAGNKQEAFGGKGNGENQIGKLSVGECRVPACPTRPSRVLLGGCCVCIQRCQKLFDAGKDPTKLGFMQLAEENFKLAPVISLSEKTKPKNDKSKELGKLAVPVAA